MAVDIHQGRRVIDGQRYPNGYQQITSLSSAAGLTPPAGTTLCILQPENYNVRLRDDGVDPTASVGFLIRVGDVWEYSGVPTSVKFIEVLAGAILNVLYYK